MRSVIPLFAFAFAAASPALATEVVPVAGFRSVELRGGGTVIVVPGQTQRVTLLEGSTRFTGLSVGQDGKLRIETCNERCPERYRMRVEIQSPTVPDLAVSGGGSISTGGGFRPQTRLSVAVNGGGRIDARAIAASAVSAAVNGGGDTLVNARSSLSAAINGGGMVRYVGNPRISSAIHGGGLVRATN